MWRLRKLNVRRNHSRLDDAPRIPASRPLTTCFIPQTTHASSLQIDRNRIHYDVWRHCTTTDRDDGSEWRNSECNRRERDPGLRGEASTEVAVSRRAAQREGCRRRASDRALYARWTAVGHSEARECR